MIPDRIGRGFYPVAFTVIPVIGLANEYGFNWWTGLFGGAGTMFMLFVCVIAKDENHPKDGAIMAWVSIIILLIWVSIYWWHGKI